MTPTELENIRANAIKYLDEATARLKERLLQGVTHVRQWEDTPYGKRTKVGRGWLCVYTPDAELRPNQYPGVRYTSSMGANSDNSFSGFLPGVTFDEALLLVYGDFLKSAGR